MGVIGFGDLYRLFLAQKAVNEKLEKVIESLNKRVSNLEKSDIKQPVVAEIAKEEKTTNNLKFRLKSKKDK
jgi:cell division protein FtsB